MVWFKYIAININKQFENCRPLDMQLEKMYDGFVMISGKTYIGLKIWDCDHKWIPGGEIETKGTIYTVSKRIIEH